MHQTVNFCFRSLKFCKSKRSFWKTRNLRIDRIRITVENQKKIRNFKPDLLQTANWLIKTNFSWSQFSVCFSKPVRAVWCLRQLRQLILRKRDWVKNQNKGKLKNKEPKTNGVWKTWKNDVEIDLKSVGPDVLIFWI